MIPEKMLEVLRHEGVAAIVTNGADGAHIVNTWNSYLNITDDKRILVPVGGMKTTESNLKQNNKVLMTIGSREVQGFHSMGTGFLIKAEAAFISQGAEFDEMKRKFPWVRAILDIKAESVTQTL
jgi:flavin reductase (DIM6/NTAB) family NADH-FMN oxidoreductase RutF